MQKTKYNLKPQTDGLCWRSARTDSLPWGKTQRPRSPTATLYKSNDQSLHANLNTHVQCYRQGNKTEVEREREITIFYKEKVPQTVFSSVQASIPHCINFTTSSLDQKLKDWNMQSLQTVENSLISPPCKAGLQTHVFLKPITKLTYQGHEILCLT